MTRPERASRYALRPVPAVARRLCSGVVAGGEFVAWLDEQTRTVYFTDPADEQHGVAFQANCDFWFEPRVWFHRADLKPEAQIGDVWEYVGEVKDAVAHLVRPYLERNDEYL
ncbi:hypothetical protein [Salininema proteolyticum]|uniref:Uncharacterized protein n=1 Tax=Salininema proteolyticum TaxID=1607685 RepID=A0ABV8TTG3_9ACTN